MSDIVDKWGKLTAERGFTQIPTYLLMINRFLEKEFQLKPVELLVLFQLVGTWWKTEEMPFPAMATLAGRCGVSTRQVQRAINKLDEMKFIVRVKRDKNKIIKSNAYSMKPLIIMLNEIAKAFPNEYPRKVTAADRKKITQVITESKNDGHESRV